MNVKDTTKLIEEIETRLTTLKLMLGTGTEGAKSGEMKQRKFKVNKRKGVGSSGPLKKLIEEGFFDTSKTDLEVMMILKKKALTFSRQDIATPMRRLVLQERLRREGDGTKENPWRYNKV
jgi:hypothetical protein